MSTTLKINGQKLDLDANPDLLFQILLGITNLEERLSSVDKRLYNLEKKDGKNNSQSQSLIQKKVG